MACVPFLSVVEISTMLHQINEILQNLEPQTNKSLITQPQNVACITSLKPINGSLVNPGLD